MKKKIDNPAQWKKDIIELDNAIIAYDVGCIGGDRIKCATGIIQQAISLRFFLLEAEKRLTETTAVLRALQKTIPEPLDPVEVS